MKRIVVLTLLIAAAQTEARRSCMKECDTRNPLPCNSWNLDVHAGVAPIIWQDRGSIDLISPTISTTSPAFSLASFPQFHQLFNVPWTVGGKLGYAVCDHLEYNLELNYLQASKKGNGITANVLDLDAQTIQLSFGTYKLLDAYFGTRYYFNRIWCERVAFYLGAKIGMTHHFNTKGVIGVNADVVSMNAITCTGTTENVCSLFAKNNVVSGGVSVGFDVRMCDCWSFFVTGEVVASGGPKIINNLLFAQPTPGPFNATNLISGSIGTEVRFPVTAGVRYMF